MAKIAREETVMAPRTDGELVEVDIEVRTPSVVLSVRVDEETARQLHRLAKRRGVRVSDILRDAAVDYAHTGWAEGESSFEVVGPDIRVSIGNRGVISDASGRMTVQNDQGWSSPFKTGAAVAG